jgi:hypothetical protein
MSREDYIASLDWIRLRDPAHPLLNTLEGGHSAINEIYLRHALQDVGERPEPTEEEDEPVLIDPQDPQLLSWYKERRTLFTHRAKLSNRFHDCTSDAERASLSDDIQAVQRQIGPLLRKIKHFKRTGEVLEARPVQDEQLHGVALMKKRNSVISTISYYKRMLENHAGRTDEDSLKKIKKWERKLKAKENEKLRLERQVARESV